MWSGREAPYISDILQAQVLLTLVSRKTYGAPEREYSRPEPTVEHPDPSLVTTSSRQTKLVVQLQVKSMNCADDTAAVTILDRIISQLYEPESLHDLSLIGVSIISDGDIQISTVETDSWTLEVATTLLDLQVVDNATHHTTSYIGEATLTGDLDGTSVDGTIATGPVA